MMELIREYVDMKFIGDFLAFASFMIVMCAAFTLVGA